MNDHAAHRRAREALLPAVRIYEHRIRLLELKVRLMRDQITRGALCEECGYGPRRPLYKLLQVERDVRSGWHFLSWEEKWARWMEEERERLMSPLYYRLKRRPEPVP